MHDSFVVPALPLPAVAEIVLPGSKSHANRAIVCACLAEGETVIRGATPCDDVEVMVRGLQVMGFDIQWIHRDRGELRIIGGVPKAASSATIDCHNAGTTIRFLASVAAITPGTWTLTGDTHMQKRPIGDLVHALRALGADITDTNGCPPIRINGGALKGGTVELRASQSSQYLTSLLLVAPPLQMGLNVSLAGELTSKGYVDLTEDTMSDFGVKIEKKSNKFFVQNTKYQTPSSYQIEADWSAAGAWLVCSELTGSFIRMPGLRTDSEQSDRMLPEAIRTLRKKGGLTLDCENFPDQVMNLCLLAAFRSGKTVLTNIANLRKKECDRISVVAAQLGKAGVRIHEQGDELVVIGDPNLFSTKPRPVTLDPHDDHRMAMCFAILGLIRGGVTILHPECVAKSYPTFFRDLETVLCSTLPVAVVGMRGAGKSSIGRKLAKALGCTHEDSDHLFEKKYGPIRTFVQRSGWELFRKREEELIAAAIKPGIVLSLGGGSLGSARTRALIKKHTIAVWLQAKESALIERLQSGKRPPLTDLPLAEEVRKFLLERGPHYREVSRIIVTPTLPYRSQIPFILRSLKLWQKPASSSRS